MSKPKNVTAEPFNPQLNQVMQAIRRDPEAPMPGAKSTGKLHPITEALRFLRGAQHDGLYDEADAEECADALEAYDAELMRGVERSNNAAKRFAAFVDAVAVSVGMEAGSDSDDVLQALVNQSAPLMEAAPKHAEPERPYFETVQGVAKVIEQHNGIALSAPLHDLPRVLSAMLADLRNEESEYVDPNALRQLVADFGGGWVDSPLDALREVLTTLQANQKPADFEDAVQKLVDASTRKENAIEAIKTILRLA